METPPEHFIDTLTRFRIPYVLSNFMSMHLGDPPQLPDGTNSVVSDYRAMIDDIFRFAADRGYRSVGFSGMLGRCADGARRAAALFKKYALYDSSSLMTGASGRPDVPACVRSAARMKTLAVIDHRATAVQFYLAIRGKRTGLGLLAMDSFPEYELFEPRISHIEQDIDAIAQACMSLLSCMIHERTTI